MQACAHNIAGLRLCAEGRKNKMERRGRGALALTRHLQYVKVMTWPPMSCAAPAPPSAAAAAAAADAEDELPVLSSRLEYLSHNYNAATT